MFLIYSHICKYVKQIPNSETNIIANNMITENR